MIARRALLVSSAALFACARDVRTAVVAAPDSARIERVEHGLIRGARIAGEGGVSLPDRMRALNVPGLSVALIQDFRVAWAKGYGFADARATKPVDTTTMFQAGSLSKPLTAMAVLKDVERGRLSLDTPANEVLVSWKLPPSEAAGGEPVTFLRLLSHTAGISVHGFPGYEAGSPVPTLVQVLNGASPANTAPIVVEQRPGSAFRYSGGGFTVVQQALIDLERRPFPEILRDTVLSPLGMEHSTYEQPLPETRRASAAAGHDALGERIAGERNIYPEMAAAGLWTTPTDLAKFAIEVALAANGRSAKVLSARAAARMITKVAATESDEVMVGLGVFIHRRDSATYFGHDGANEGFQARLLMNPDRGYGAAMMANADQGLDLMDEVEAAIATEYAWEGYPAPVTIAKLDPAKLAPLAGTYRVSADRLWRIAARGDRLVLTSELEEPSELLPTSPTTFVSRTTTDRYAFEGPRVRVTPPGPGPIERVSDDATVPLDAIAAGNFDEALARYRAAKAAAPNDATFGPERLTGLGIRQMWRGNPRAALLLLRVCVALHPDSASAKTALTWAEKRAHF